MRTGLLRAFTGALLALFLLSMGARAEVLVDGTYRKLIDPNDFPSVDGFIAIFCFDQEQAFICAYSAKNPSQYKLVAYDKLAKAKVAEYGESYTGSLGEYHRPFDYYLDEEGYFYVLHGSAGIKSYHYANDAITRISERSDYVGECRDLTDSYFLNDKLYIASRRAGLVVYSQLDKGNMGAVKQFFDDQSLYNVGVAHGRYVFLPSEEWCDAQKGWIIIDSKTDTVVEQSADTVFEYDDVSMRLVNNKVYYKIAGKHFYRDVNVDGTLSSLAVEGEPEPEFTEHNSVVDESIYDNHILSSSPMGYWSMNTLDNYQVVDITSNGFDGSIGRGTDLVRLEPKMLGKGYKDIFGINLPLNISLIDTASVYSVEFWSNSAGAVFATASQSEDTDNGAIGIDRDGGLYFKVNNIGEGAYNKKWVSNNSNASESEYLNHYVFVFNGPDKECHFYINSKKETIACDFVIDDDVARSIDVGLHTNTGSAGSFIPYPFYGVLSKLAFYDRMLTDTEISSHYNKGIAAEQNLVNLQGWSEADYDDGGAGDWTVSEDGSSVRQNNNGNPTFYISDFGLSGSRFEGSFTVDTTEDDDFVGFVFGFRELAKSYYLFSWKKAFQVNGSNGDGEEGFKIAKVSGQQGLNHFNEFWDLEDSQFIKVLGSDTGTGKGWIESRKYTFSLSYQDTGAIRVLIKDNESDSLIWDSGLIVDPEPIGVGHVGFYNFSQSDVVYEGFTKASLLEPVARLEKQAPISFSYSEITLDGSNSFDPDTQNTANNGIISWQWDIGDDGTVDSTHEKTLVVQRQDLFAKGLTLTTPVPVRLTVTDADGLVNSTTSFIAYENTPPLLSIGGPYPLVQPDGALVTDAMIDDPDLAHPVGEQLQVEWDYRPAQQASDVGDGLVSGGIEIANHSFPYNQILDYINQHGSTLYLNVVDQQGAVVSRSTEVQVALPDLKILEASVSGSFKTNQPLTFKWKGINQGAAPVKTDWEECLWISEDTELDYENDFWFEYIPLSIELNTDDVYEREVVFPWLDIPSGEYYVLFEANCDRYVQESDTGNNVYATGPFDTKRLVLLESVEWRETSIGFDQINTLTLMFYSPMRQDIKPTIRLVNETDAITLSGGQWSGSFEFRNNELFIPDGLNGVFDLVVTGAQDETGQPMELYREAAAITVDTIKPPVPTVISPTLEDDLYRSSYRGVSFSGEMEPYAEVMVNGQLAESTSETTWFHTVQAPEGISEVRIVAWDQVGNPSDTKMIRLEVDTIAPVLGTVTPSGALATAPANIQLAVIESGTGIDLAASRIDLFKDNVAISGELSIADSLITWTPAQPLSEGVYSLETRIVDLVGNESDPQHHLFTLDFTPPTPPVAVDVPAISETELIQIEGTRESGSSVYLYDTLVASGDGTTWGASVSLKEGDNVLHFTARDAVGNVSEVTPVTVRFDNTPPGPVAVDSDPEGDGRSVLLRWDSYDDIANGADVESYWVYRSSTPFTNLSDEGVGLIGQVAADTRQFRIGNLERNTTVYVAVVARDKAENMHPVVSPVEVTPIDTIAPAEISDLSFMALGNSLQLRWGASPDEAGDLAAYRITVTRPEGEEVIMVPVVAGESVVSHTIQGLAMGTAYPIRVQAVDQAGNTSSGLSGTGVTLLPNPDNVTLEALDGRAIVRWSAVLPAEQVTGYRIYRSEKDFSSITDLTPALSLASDQRQAGLSGLTNGTTYYVAVTAINLSGKESADVTPVAVTPFADESGPSLTTIAYAGSALLDGRVLTTNGTVSVQATDPSGVARLQLLVDGEVIARDVTPADGLELPLDLRTLSDGDHVLVVQAVDTLENISEQSYAITVDLAAPATPVLTGPVDGRFTNQPVQIVQGTSVADTEVRLLRNAEPFGDWLAVSDGRFSLGVDLEEGENTLAVQARFVGRSKVSATSEQRTITLDTAIPDAPAGFNANSRAQGEVNLSWQPVDADLAGYYVYRSSQPFSAPGQATVDRITLSPITATRIEDVPAEDGIYYYAVTAVTRAGSESEPGGVSEVVVDSIGPKIESVTLSSSGRQADDGRYGQGSVEVEVWFTEPLRNPPHFAFSLGASAITVSLTPDYNEARRYTGSFSISGSTPSGTADLTFQAFDAVGNQGGELVSGERMFIRIDTSGPDVKQLAITPEHPINNGLTGGNIPATVEVRIALNDDLGPDVLPVLVATLDGLPIVGMEAGIPLVRDALALPGQPLLSGEFTLPVDAGAGSSQLLGFTWQAEDDLGNRSTRINGTRTFEVYQGELPALASPVSLEARALPQGRVDLGWQVVTQASGYQIERKAANEDDFNVVAEVLASGSDVQRWQEVNALVDGQYQYRVASIRSANGQRGISEASQPVMVIADGTAPDAPEALRLRLNGAGVVVEWQAPVSEAVPHELRYNLYRLDTAEGEPVDLTDVEPLQRNIPGNAFIALDPEPSTTAFTYTVTAMDSAGNESAPGMPQYLNANLLPVSNLAITLNPGGQPVISWSHSGQGVAGYDVYRGVGDSRIKLNSTPLTAKSITDISYNGGQVSHGAVSEQLYTVIAVDANGSESEPHSLRLPALTVQLAGNEAELKRGVMNQVSFRVDNTGTTRAGGLLLTVDTRDHNTWRSHRSGSFSVAAGSFIEVPVVIGGYTGLNALSTLRLKISQYPNPGEQVTISQQAEVSVGHGGLVAGLSATDFTRGSTGKSTFTLENTSAVETEILVARNNGNSASNEIRLVLSDAEGNRLATTPVRQFSGTDVITLGNGDTVARLQPGQRFVSEPVIMAVPGGSPDDVQLSLEIDRFHYHRGKPDAVAIAGTGSRTRLTLVETNYTGIVSEVDQLRVFGQQPVTITGQAIERASQQPAPNRLLSLVFDRSGFEKVISVQTGADGSFSYTYVPDRGESGQVRVVAIYPGSTDRPWAEAQTFVVENARVNWERYNLRLVRNYPEKIPLQVSAGRDTTLTNVRLEAIPLTGSDDVAMPAGITLAMPEAITIQPNRTGYLNLQVSADNNAEVSSLMRFAVRSDNHDEPLGTLLVNSSVSEGTPALTFAPGHIETGVKRGEGVTESLTLTNNSLAAVTGITAKLTEENSDTPAPPWVRLAVNPAIGDIPVGEKRTVAVNLSPDETLNEGNYTFDLHITSSNGLGYVYKVYAAVTQAGEGNVFIHASDIYTATLDDYGRIIKGLAGARVKLQNEQVLTEVYEGVTDEDGNLLLENVPTGRYFYRASAYDHEDVSGRLWVKPGVTTAEEMFLTNNLITVEWEVKEITLEDRYEIKLEAEYKTNVPAAVVVVEPMSINLPVMRKGDVFNGEITLTNHGLIRADALAGDLPQGNGVASFQYLQPVPETLAPGEAYTLPYRIIANQSFNSGEGGSAAGVGCWRHQYWGSVSWQSQCANGQTVDSRAGMTWYVAGGSCGSTGGVSTPATGSGGGSGGGYGGGISYGNGGTSISGADTWCPADVRNCVVGQCDSLGGGFGGQ